jgi:orotidine-5'-phosphate decarboxylase
MTSSPSSNPVFVALDTTDLDYARQLAERLRGHIGGVKLGLEFFCAHGPDGVRAFQDMGLPIFLDLKFHDIPNTVAGAVRAAATLGVDILNVHAAGGPAMMKAWKQRAASIPKPK